MKNNILLIFALIASSNAWAAQMKILMCNYSKKYKITIDQAGHQVSLEPLKTRVMTINTNQNLTLSAVNKNDSQDKINAVNWPTQINIAKTKNAVGKNVIDEVKTVWFIDAGKSLFQYTTMASVGRSDIKIKQLDPDYAQKKFKTTFDALKMVGFDVNLGIQHQ